MKNNRYYYLVEGSCEKKIVSIFKEQNNLIVSGKVLEYNVIQNKISDMYLRTLSENTTVILVFDTDTENVDILKENLDILMRNDHVKNVWCVTQVRNLEDELIRSTDVSQVKFLVGSKSNKDFKHDLIIEKRLYEKLRFHHFDFSKLWDTKPTGIFAFIDNDGRRIKLK